MAATKTLYLTIIGLVVFAAAATALRVTIRGDEGLPAGDSAWSIRLTHEIEALEKGAAVNVPPPWDTRYARLYSQTLSHEGLRQLRGKAAKKGRDINLVAPEPGVYSIESEFVVHISSLPLSDAAKPSLTEKNRAAWLASSNGIKVESPSVQAIVERIAGDNPEPGRMIEQLFNYVSSNIRISRYATSDSDAALESRQASPLGAARALTALLRHAHLPARIVTGIDLHKVAELQPQYWAEVYDGETWLALDPANGYLIELPIFYVPMRKGSDQLINTEHAVVNASSWGLAALPAQAGYFSTDTRKLTDILDLTRLAPGSREILSALLLLPLGVLATELVRQFGGIRTYGTFTPTLLALAVTFVHWVTAALVLLLVTAIGIATRAAMPDLELQRTPRLAIVFTLIAISMSLVVSGISYFDPAVDNTVTLLPLVILTMLVDRIYTVYDERGLHAATVRLGWTLAAAAVSVFILLQTHWGAWLVAYPEMHAITLAVIILVGLYSGPRLVDLPALRLLREPPRQVRNRRSDPAQSEQSGDSL